MPVKDELQEFLRERQAKSAPAHLIDWESRKRDWVHAVERLYDTIANDLLKDSLAEKLVQVQRRDTVVEERYIGKYTIPELVVQIGDEEVVFSPKGVTVIGVAGRVDLIGERSEATIILEHGLGMSQDNWSIVERRIPSPKLVPLTKETLLASLRDVMSP